MGHFKEITVALPDGYEAYGRYWNVDKPRGAVLYLHGIQSHCGWYETSARRLGEAGLAVLQVDRRGSGQNAAHRGHAESAEQLIEDALAARDELLRRSGREAYHIVGVSWGGKLAVAQYVHDPGGVASLSLVTPGLFPRVGVSKQQMSEIGFAMLYEPQRRFDIPLNDADLFTTSPRWAKYFEADALTLRQCTAAFYLASRRMDRIAARLPESPPVPTHLLLAADERIIDNDRTTEFFRALAWGRTRVTTYRSARHGLEFEEESEQYFGDLVSFVRDANR